MQIACLTLVLPPTHPAIAQHPLFPVLPKNRYTREYMTSVEALGGIKRWIGEPRKFKVRTLPALVLTYLGGCAEHDPHQVHR